MTTAIMLQFYFNIITLILFNIIVHIRTHTYLNILQNNINSVYNLHYNLHPEVQMKQKIDKYTVWYSKN